MILGTKKDVLGPREAANLPVRLVCLVYWTLCSSQNEVTYNYNPSFLPHDGGHNTGGMPF